MKRGGDRVRTTWEEADFETEVPPDELIAIDEALKKLEIENPKAAEVVKAPLFRGHDHPGSRNGPWRLAAHR